MFFGVCFEIGSRHKLRKTLKVCLGTSRLLCKEMEDSGKADTPSKERYFGSQNRREDGHKIQEVWWETNGVKTLGRADTLSNTNRIRPVDSNIQNPSQRKKKRHFWHVEGRILACRRAHFGMSTGRFIIFPFSILPVPNAFWLSTGAVFMFTSQFTIFHFIILPVPAVFWQVGESFWHADVRSLACRRAHFGMSADVLACRRVVSHTKGGHLKKALRIKNLKQESVWGKL